ncbi:MAG: hypothetical protein Q9163_003740 [Psora crenata]
MFELDVARALAAQLALAVAFMHNRGYVHGDLHLGNVLLRLPSSISQLSDEQLYEHYGQPELEPVARFDGKELAKGIPSGGVIPVRFVGRNEQVKLPEAKILLVDFSESFAPSQEAKYESNTPASTRPPEARFEQTKPLSFPSDIWSLGCGIWSILSQRPLFEPYLFDDDDVTRD